MYNNPIATLRPEEVIMYLRKSRADDPLMTVEELLSKHETDLDEWVGRNLSAPIPQENRYKEIISGGDSIEERIEFQKVLKAIESPNIKAVIVKEISRLGRPDTMEIGRISKIFRYTKTLVITPMKIFDIADDFEREMFENELKRGQYYLEYTKKILKSGREISAKAGNYIATTPPYGYDKTVVMDGKRKCPTLVINEEEADHIRMMFNAYAYENIGTQRIANRLNDMGVKSPKGLPWRPDTIRDILDNPLYMGKIRWNQRKAIYVVDNGEFRRTRPINEGDDVIYVDGRHEPLISEELFNKVQEERKKRHRTSGNKELRNPLASLLFCECGRAICYRHSTRGNLKYREPRLVCNGQHYCGNGSCSVPEIVDFVAQVLRDRIAYFENLIENQENDSNDFNLKQLKNLEKKLTDLNAKEVALWEAQLDETNRMPQNVFQTLTDKLIKERSDTESAIEKTKAMISEPATREAQLVTLTKALDALLDPEMSATEKNYFLKACIERIDYRRDLPQKIIGKGMGRQWTAPPIELNVKLKV